MIRQFPAGMKSIIIDRASGLATTLNLGTGDAPVGWLDGDRSLLGVSYAPEPEGRDRFFVLDLSSATIRYLGLSADRPRQVRVNSGELLFSAGHDAIELWRLETRTGE
jgi:hypothetical protein